MILFLEHAAERKRGGEIYFAHLHGFFKKRFKDVLPQELEKLLPRLRNPINHMKHKWKLAQKHQPDLIVVDISSAFRSALAVHFMKKRKRTILVVVQGERQSFRYNIFFLKWLVRSFEKYLLRSASMVITNSNYIAHRSKRYIRKRIPFIMANPGLELSFSPDSNNLHIVNKKSPVELLFVGQCAYRKGLKGLVEAIGILKGLDIHLNIAGGYNKEDRYFKEVNKIINQERLQAKITFHGFLDRPQLNKLYRTCNIFIMPSLAEGFGMALAEAICFGLPIVASTAGAIPELVADGVNAVLVKPKDSKGIAAGIRRLIEDKNLRVSMSKANLEKAKILPSWDDFDRIMEERLAPLIEKLPR